MDAKKGRMPDPETAFIGFGCSFGGKWFDGYATDDPKKYQYPAQNAYNSLMRQTPKIKTAVFFHADFLTTDPPAPNCLIYCDPPYQGTKTFGACKPFNHEVFWQRIRDLEAMGHICIVSEYQAPTDFTAVLVQKTRTDLRDAQNKKKTVLKSCSDTVNTILSIKRCLGWDMTNLLKCGDRRNVWS